MPESVKADKKPFVFRKRPIVITFVGAIVTIILILVTLEISRDKVSTFITSQQKYIVAIESVMLAIFIVEMVVGFITLLLHTPQTIQHVARLRLTVRIVGYFIALMSVVSIIASNATLGISVGAVAGVVIAFATQNVLGNIIAAVLILGTQMVRVGEEITVGQTTGVISDINLNQTVLTIEDEVVFIPNTLIISSVLRRKKRDLRKDADAHDW